MVLTILVLAGESRVIVVTNGMRRGLVHGV